jgi:hypothetical protein
MAGGPVSVSIPPASPDVVQTTTAVEISSKMAVFFSRFKPTEFIIELIPFPDKECQEKRG